MSETSYYVALAFVASLYLFGAYDLWAIYFSESRATSITWEIRHSWLAWPMGWALVGFGLLHFIPH